MQRRALLAGVGATLSTGCLSVSGPVGNSMGNMNTSNPSVTVTTSSIEPELNLALETTVVEQFNGDSPAKLTIELDNVGDVSRSFGTGPSPPFDPSRGRRRDDDGAMFLLPSDGTGYEPTHDETGPDVVDVEPVDSENRLIPDQPTDGCWQARSRSVRVYSMARGETLEPGESIRRTYVLLAHPDNDPCLPEGSYEFTDEAQVDDQPMKLTIVLTVTDDYHE